MNIYLFEVKKTNWITDTLLISQRASFYTSTTINNIQIPNPYKLPTIASSKITTVIVTTNFDEWLFKNFTTEEIVCFYETLQNSFNVIAIDTFATFELGFSNFSIKYFSKIIKPQGIYKNKKLYINNVISEKDIDKIKLSFPCFIGVIPKVRNAVRKIRGTNRIKNNFLFFADKTIPFMSSWIKKTKDINFIGSATNTERLKLINILSKNNYSIDLFITSFPEKILNFDTNEIVDLASLSESLIRERKIVLLGKMQ